MATAEDATPARAQRPWVWAVACSLAAFGVLAAGWWYAERSFPGGLELEGLLYLAGFPALFVVCLLTWLAMGFVRGRARYWVATVPLVVSIVGTFLITWGFPPDFVLP